MSKREEKKLALLNVGCDVIYSKGYHATGIQDIVNAANIPKGSFYNYFDSKETFAVEAIEYVAEQIHAILKKALTNAEISPLARIFSFFDQMIAHFTQTNFEKGCLVGNMCQEMSDSSSAIRTAADTQMQRFSALFAGCLREAIEAGEISPETDIDTLSEFIFNSWEGALLRMKSSKSGKPLLQFREVLEQVILH